MEQLRAFHELIRFTDQDMRDMRDEIDAEAADAAASAELERARTQRAVGLCDERLARLTDAVIDGIVDKEAYDARKAEILMQRRSLLNKLESPAEATSRLLKKFPSGGR